MRRVVEQDFVSNGFRCVVLFLAGGHRCGYVAIPKGHKYYGKHYDDIPLDCHGGLTYAEKSLHGVESEDVWWVGYDTAHYGDAKDFGTARKYFKDDVEVMRLIQLFEENERFSMRNETVRTLDYCITECISMTEQLMEENEDE